MKRVLLILLLITLPAFAAEKRMIPTSSGKDDLPNIFIYSMPDLDTSKEAPSEDIIYVDTPEKTSDEVILEEEDILSATTLKGYASYMEDSNAIHLKDENNNYVLNIKTPQKISATKSLNLSTTPKKQLTQYQDAEYIIAPSTIKAASKTGDFTFGALYGNEIDNIAMLETETGLFTKYEKDRFAISSSFKKSLNTTYAKDYNTISFTPELKVNNYISLKNKLSADITRNRRSSELVFSLNPFGKKDKDRMLLELGAKETVYMDTGFNKTQFSFSTIFKL